MLNLTDTIAREGKNRISVGLALISVYLCAAILIANLAGCSSLPGGRTQAEWDALSPAEQTRLWDAEDKQLKASFDGQRRAIAEVERSLRPPGSRDPGTR